MVTLFPWGQREEASSSACGTFFLPRLLLDMLHLQLSRHSEKSNSLRSQQEFRCDCLGILQSASFSRDIRTCSATQDRPGNVWCGATGCISYIPNSRLDVSCRLEVSIC